MAERQLRVPVSPELQEQLATAWSEPVELRLVDGELIARTPVSEADKVAEPRSGNASG